MISHEPIAHSVAGLVAKVRRTYSTPNAITVAELPAELLRHVARRRQSIVCARVCSVDRTYIADQIHLPLQKALQRVAAFPATDHEHEVSYPSRLAGASAGTTMAGKGSSRYARVIRIAVPSWSLRSVPGWAFAPRENTSWSCGTVLPHVAQTLVTPSILLAPCRWLRVRDQIGMFIPSLHWRPRH